MPSRWIERIALDPTDLLRDPTYRRLWTSILISSFGGQVTLLALPLSAAVLLHASPTQMGILTAAEIVPFALFSLPSGVWLDRVRKLPVYIVGELSISATVASVPVAWWLGWLSIDWLYFVGFVIGAVNTTAGSAAQIVLTQIVPRERLVEAHAKNALASSTAEVTGPAAAGALIKITGAPAALLADALLLLVSSTILRGVPVQESPSAKNAPFWPAMREGLRFVRGHDLLHHHGRLCRRVADVQSSRDGRSDPVRNAPARTVRARRRLELRRLGRRYGRRQHTRLSRRAASGAGADAGAWICHQRLRLAGAGRGAVEPHRRGCIRLHAAVVRRGRGLHIH